MIWKNYTYPLDYAACLNIMHSHVENIIAGSSEDIVMSLEHEDVYTIGTSGKLDDIICNEDNIKVLQTQRGGKVTYHGAGQLILYPLINLNNQKIDLRWYINCLSEVIINLCKYFGLKGFYDPENVGVWVYAENDCPKKIASIGIRIRKWVTYHGIAINICPNMSKFSGIRPCGLDARDMTSFETLGVKADMRLVNEILRYEFYKVFV